MSESADLQNILVVLIAAVAVVPVFRRFGASAVLGYLVAGALIGPEGLDLVDLEAIGPLAELGVVFLLFSVGLELSVRRIVRLRRYVFGLGAAQVAATGLLLWACLRALGLATTPAIVLAAGLALSSTAVVMQMLLERRELGTTHGRLAFSVLLFQDLAVAPLLALVALLGPSGGGGAAIGLALLKGIAVLVVIVAAGRFALRPLLRGVARSRNAELFTGIALLLTLGLGWLTERFGLSMALGAFLAGLLIAETEYRPQVEADIQPFRGILLALFFMTVGMRTDLSPLVERAPTVAALLAALLVLKAGALALLGRAFGLTAGLAGALGLMLAQGGEFGFVLFAQAVARDALAADVGNIAVLVVGLSMGATPVLLAASRALLRRLPAEHQQGEAIADAARELRAHAVIAGFGRVGQTLALLLESRSVPYIALDLDAERVAEARERGVPVHFGDATRADVLRTAGVERARLAAITLDHPDDARRAVEAVRQLHPELCVVVRARDARHCDRLIAAGATAVVPELVEGSLQLGATLLRHLDHPREEVDQLLEEFRRRAYAQLPETVVRREAGRE